MPQSNPERVEFTRYRSIVLKRLKRLKPEQKTKEAQQILQYGLPTIKDLKEKHKNNKVTALTLDEEIRQMTQYFKYLYNKESLSITGQKKIKDKRLEALNLHYNVSNLQKFGEYMERIRQFYGMSKVASAEAAEYYSNNPQIESGNIAQNWDKIQRGFEQFRNKQYEELAKIERQAAEKLLKRFRRNK